MSTLPNCDDESISYWIFQFSLFVVKLRILLFTTSKDFFGLYNFLSMSRSNPNILYKAGICRNLDEKLRIYRKTRIWCGRAVSNALTKTEVDVLARLWRKERETLWKMTVNEVSTLMEFCDRIVAWRKTNKKEQSRQRMENMRAKRVTLTRQGDKQVRRKLEGIKKYQRSKLHNTRKGRGWS